MSDRPLLAMPPAPVLTVDILVPRHSKRATAEALFSLSQTQRRLSHRYRAWAAEAEQNGDLADFGKCTIRARDLWRSAKFHFGWARQEFQETTR